jgi:hypothetical protein
MNAAARRWAVLPQLGYGPRDRPEIGLKYGHRNIADSGVTIDVDGVYALNKQQSFGLSVGYPDIMDERFLVLGQGGLRKPIRPFDFFGLGNNDLGTGPGLHPSHRERHRLAHRGLASLAAPRRELHRRPPPRAHRPRRPRRRRYALHARRVPRPAGHRRWAS